jgi:UDP-N-acetylglucosamine:LPS N-acetylglucosamine transferase
VTRARRRVLIVYANVGGGHLSAARALADALESTGEITTRLVDAYLDCGRFPVTLFPAMYARLARRHPRLWSMLYYGSDRYLDPQRMLSPLVIAGFRRVIERDQPDLVVSVLPVVNSTLARAAAEHGAKLEVVLTDWYAVHRFWVTPGVAHYTAPTAAARLECIRLGAPPDSVEAVGIPVRGDFATGLDRQAVRTEKLSELGLDPHRFTILAMVGAEGSPRAFRNIAGLAQLNLDAQLVVICGRNDELQRRVQQLPACMPLRAIGFTNQVADLMRAADVLVTKAGGLTLAEAFCCSVPVVVHDVLPGQETGNLAYVLKHNAVEYAPNPRTLVQVVSELYREPDRRTELTEQAARLARPDAAARIARGLLERMNE